VHRGETYGMASDHEFDAVALAWQRWFPHAGRDAPRQRADGRAGAIGPGAHVLDVGGLGIRLCSPRNVAPNGNVIGVDISPAMLSLARKRAHKTASRTSSFAGGKDDEIPAGPYDAILTLRLDVRTDSIARSRSIARSCGHARLVAARGNRARGPQISRR